MFLVGKTMPNDASNLPLSVQNSIVTPSDTLTVVAGNLITLNLELRTTNA